MNQPMTSGLQVIFGITGDLARRYLLPALYHLSKDSLLPDGFEIIGITRREFTVDDLIGNLKSDLSESGEHPDPKAIADFAKLVRMVRMDMTSPEDYKSLKKTLDEIEDERGTCLNRLFYLAIPPQIFGPVVDYLGESGLNNGCQHGVADSRLMVEKPFGYDLASANELIVRLRRSFNESQIYRIDHYLAKESAQNILVVRYSNPLIQALWEGHHISSITVTASESIGVEGRAGFYDATGALRDLVQNHLLQILTLVTMELPKKLDSSGIHSKKLEQMKAILTVQPDDVARVAKRGQYDGYATDVHNPDTYTETLARLELSIDSDRWRGVKLVLQTGKSLDSKTTQVVVEFARGELQPNYLIFHIHPYEGVSISLTTKKSGFGLETQQIEMSLKYSDFQSGQPPTAYERVMVDGINGDQTLFATSDEVLESWRIVDSVVNAWSKSGEGLIHYRLGATLEEVLDA